MYTYNASGEDMAENFEEKQQSYIGDRIQRIRKEQKILQSELGKAVGLGEGRPAANRIAQYESGARKPRTEILKKIADVLGVETAALADPVTWDSTGAMYAFFEMERLFGLTLNENPVTGKILISFEEGSEPESTAAKVNANLRVWYERQKKRDEDLRAAEKKADRQLAYHDYHMWEWNWPHAEDFSKENIAAKRKSLQDLDEAIQRQLKILESYGEELGLKE